MGEVSVRAMEKLGYNNVGTIEYLLDENGQLLLHGDEHPHPGGAPRHRAGHRHRPGARADQAVRGPAAAAAPRRTSRCAAHAIECRVNAEDPVTFAPWPGKITAYSAPGGYGVRVDSSAYENYTVLPYYDSLLAKLIVYAEDRPTAIRRMQRALDEYVVQGIRTNIPFHRAAMAEQDFIDGNYDTRFVERLLASETGAQRLRRAIEETP